MNSGVSVFQILISLNSLSLDFEEVLHPNLNGMTNPNKTRMSKIGTSLRAHETKSPEQVLRGASEKHNTQSGKK